MFEFNSGLFEKRLTAHSKAMQAAIVAAEVRALNIVAARAFTAQVKEVAAETGQTQKEIRKEARMKRATRRNPTVYWHFTGFRYSVRSPSLVARTQTSKRTGKKYKRGIGVRYKNSEGQRVTRTGAFVPGATKGFIIQGQNSGRKTAVYRKPGFKRKVTTVQASSRQHIVKHFSFPAARKQIRQGLHAEIKNQLKRSGYVK